MSSTTSPPTTTTATDAPTTSSSSGGGGRGGLGSFGNGGGYPNGAAYFQTVVISLVALALLLMVSVVSPFRVSKDESGNPRFMLIFLLRAGLLVLSPSSTTYLRSVRLAVSVLVGFDWPTNQRRSKEEG